VSEYRPPTAGDGGDEIDPITPDHPVITAATWYGHDLDFGLPAQPPRLRLWLLVIAGNVEPRAGSIGSGRG
jgi:hypothetical protein